MKYMYPRIYDKEQTKGEEHVVKWGLETTREFLSNVHKLCVRCSMILSSAIIISKNHNHVVHKLGLQTTLFPIKNSYIT